MKTFLPQPLWLNSFRSFTERLFGRVATLYWISMNVEEGSPRSGQRWWVWWDGVIAPWKAETHLAGSPKKRWNIMTLWNIQVLEAQCNCKSIKIHSRNFLVNWGECSWTCGIAEFIDDLGGFVGWCWVHVQQQRLTCPYPVLAMICSAFARRCCRLQIVDPLVLRWTCSLPSSEIRN